MKLRKTRIDVYETLCPQQMLVHKGGKIKNWDGECRDVTPTKLQFQNILKEQMGSGCGGGGGGGGVRMDMNEELKIFVKIQKKNWGGGGQGRCERRIEVFVNIQTRGVLGVRLGGGGGSGWM